MALSDTELMARVQQGDREVFDDLVARYASRLKRVAHSKLGDPALAEDVVQETFLAAYRARDSYDSRFAVSTWLWTILLNLCRRHWKRIRSRAVIVSEGWDASHPEPIDERTPTTLEALICQEDRHRLHKLLAELPEVQADALRLRFFGGLSFEEIAVTTDCSLSGAKRRVKTGLNRLSFLIRSLEEPLAADSTLQTEGMP
jgi:RNA polymerase sigma-70 factor, ECF subfamily